jgi:putative flavoprotein involved in K+ transport
MGIQVDTGDAGAPGRSGEQDACERITERWIRALNTAVTWRTARGAVGTFVADSHWRNLSGILVFRDFSGNATGDKGTVSARAAEVRATGFRIDPAISVPLMPWSPVATSSRPYSPRER